MSENRFLSKLSSPYVLVFLLVTLALSAVFFGWKGWRSSFKFALISNGIDYNSQINQDNNDLPTETNKQVLDFNDPSLRVKDTDSDGLTDWDELNVYKTSPYIPDTDSDSISDGDEIKMGNNPLCAEGNNCLTEEIMPATTSSVNFLDNQQGLSDIYPTTTNDIEALKNISSKELRQLLVDKGYSLQDLNQLTDEQLIEIWRQALEQINKQ